MNRRIFVGIVIVSIGTNVVVSGLVRPVIARHLSEAADGSWQNKVFAAAYQLAGGH